MNLIFTKMYKNVKNMRFCWFFNSFEKIQLPQFPSNFQKYSLKMFGRAPTFEKNIFKNLKNYLRRQNGPKMGKNGFKKWKICNFANFKPFIDELFLYNAMPKYSIWSCQHFGTKKLKIKWEIKSQWSFENIFLMLFTPLCTTENDWGIWVFLGAEWYNGIFL